MTTNEAVLLVDWLNLSIHLKNQRLSFGSDLVGDLIKIARDECARHGSTELVRAHFVGERFAPSVEDAITNTLIARFHKTRTAKEQADLVLAVLAMDHIHAPGGAPGLFLLATGDQDFIPLVDRMIDARADVILVVASTRTLSPEYRRIAAQQNVRLLSLTDVLDIKPLPESDVDAAATRVLGLYRVCLEGGVLGGDQTRNIRMLTDWGLLQPGDQEVEHTACLQQFARVDSRKVAIPAKRETGNRPAVLRRTTLNFASSTVREVIEDADWVLRRTGNAARPPTIGDLGVGRFATDDGRRLARVIGAMKDVGWLLERSDGRFESRLEWSADGLLEPLWRVICEINRRAFADHTEGVSRDRLFQDLRSTPIASDIDRKGGKAAQAVIDYARRIGVIDAIPAGSDGYALAVIEAHPVAQSVTSALRTLGSLLRDRAGAAAPEHEVLALMRERDEHVGGQVLFGYDNRDRQRFLRVLRRSGLMERPSGNEPTVRLKRTPWLERIS
ncbi:NYN domain-containing protein [Micromonospora krabiensis]|uniref:NYN domain-containing protein n=2 Tax=Micromonospora krabiensis TaxID=307121 RepID=A0A1C3N4K2_9ACTN|nr:NYN domain-containing protein [Micromonospora krabiensis]